MKKEETRRIVGIFLVFFHILFSIERKRRYEVGAFIRSAFREKTPWF